MVSLSSLPVVTALVNRTNVYQQNRLWFIDLVPLPVLFVFAFVLTVFVEFILDEYTTLVAIEKC